MDTPTWQKRLEDNFSGGGVVGSRLIAILDQEKDFGKASLRFHGFRVMMDSFLDFFIESLEKANEWAIKRPIPNECASYAPTLVGFVTVFKSFRAAELLFCNGYPLDGFALLRDLKDTAIQISAVANKETTFDKLNGGESPARKTEKLTPELYRNVRRFRKKEEKRISEIYFGSKSGLDESTREQLKRWNELFDEEVHGSRLTFFFEGGHWLLKQAPLIIGPDPKDVSNSMYMNRAAEIAWMFCRLLPWLQLNPREFGEEWSDKWEIMDDSLRHMVESLGHDGKPIGFAISKLLSLRFLFSPGTHYQEQS